MLLLTAVFSSGATALVVAPTALAEANYSCTECTTESGPNQSIDFIGGTDYTYTEVGITMWKYNGGSSYTEEFGETSITTYYLSHCTGEDVFSGHGQVNEGSDYKAHLSGHEDGARTCS
jgi:hypothetical protein